MNINDYKDAALKLNEFHVWCVKVKCKAIKGIYDNMPTHPGGNKY